MTNSEVTSNFVPASNSIFIEKLSESHFGKKSLFNIPVIGNAKAEKNKRSVANKNIFTLLFFSSKYFIALPYFVSKL